jgi:Sortase domain
VNRRVAQIVLAVALVLLAAVTIAAFAWPSGTRRADLVGPAVHRGTGSERPTTTSTTSRSTDTTTSTTSPPPTTPTVVIRPARPAADPVRVRIPSIGVDASVRAEGLASDGSMAVPPVREVGWYAPGSAPGDEQGSAVLAGHVDYNGVRGAFFDLRALVAGSEVVVTDTAGSDHRFRVTERFQVGKGELPIQRLFRRTGAPALTLITCGGAFNPSLGHYADNIVVVANPVT